MLHLSKSLRNLHISWEGLTNPKSVADSCADSEGDLHIKPACAIQVDVDTSENFRECQESSQLSVFAMLNRSKLLRNLNISKEGLTNPESAADSCADSEGDLQMILACAVKVDVDMLENLAECRESSQLSVVVKLI